MSEFSDEDRTVLIKTHTLLQTHIQKSEDHEKRIRSVEKKQNYLLAGLGALGLTSFPSFAALLGKLL